MYLKNEALIMQHLYYKNTLLLLIPKCIRISVPVAGHGWANFNYVVYYCVVWTVTMHHILQTDHLFFVSNLNL